MKQTKSHQSWFRHRRNAGRFMTAASSLLVATALLTGCTEEKDWSGGLKPTDLVFQTFMPTSGGKGTTLNIQGNNFGTDPAQVKVWVNDTEATILSVEPTRIKAELADGTGSGDVKVQVGETVYTYPTQFTYAYVTKVTTVAGTGVDGTTDGDALRSQLVWPINMAYDSWDNSLVFLQDNGNIDNIRRLKNGKLETLCAVGGLLTNARTIAFSVTGDTLFIGNDGGSVAVAMVTRKGGFKDLKALVKYSDLPHPNINGITVNPADGSLFTYHWPKAVCRYDLQKNTVSEVIGHDEFASLTEGRFGDNNVASGSGNYGDIIFSPDGKTLYWSGRDPYQGLLKADYDPETKKCSNLSVFAGSGCWGNDDGQGAAATIDQPGQMGVDREGNVYVGATKGRNIRKITPEGYMSTVAGIGWKNGYVDGLANEAKFEEVHSLAVAPNGDIYAGDCYSWRIRLIHNE